MLVLSSEISDWKDLQNRVASFFKEMGYHTETPKVVSLVRGAKEVDVYVRDDKASVNQVTLVECKLWSTNVPQDTVHSFQTVMEGCGANTGFIVSRTGFQTGAVEAATKTNIHLVTWEDLQHRFGKQWLGYQASSLELVVAEMRGITSAHLDQMQVAKAIHNNMFYRSREDWEELLRTLNDLRVALGAAMGQPKRYDEPKPICVPVYEGFPNAAKDKYGLYNLEFRSVRDFYAWLLPWSKSLIERYRNLSKVVRKKFDDLPEEAQDDVFKTALGAMREETPVRAFRKLLGDEAYFSLLNRLDQGEGTDGKAKG